MAGHPRITPTRRRMEAIVGRWEFSGKTVRLMEEVDSGSLIALTEQGEHVNPVRVISRGKKLGLEEARI